MEITMNAIRSAMYQILEGLYPDLDLLENGRYSVEDILDQVIMEYIIKDYQQSATRQSIRQHRNDNGMITQLDDAATAQRYNRLVEKANHYKQINAQQLLESSGVEIIDQTKNDMSGPSNWQNAYTLTAVEFHELTMQDQCKLLKKIFEHKISSKSSVPNPEFKSLFTEYSSCIEELYQSMDLDDPNSIIAKTTEFFVLQWKYNVDIFYGITAEAVKFNFPRPIPYRRIMALCCPVSRVAPVPWYPYEIPVAYNRMLMKRECYINDIFTLSDEDWAFQLDIIGDTVRLINILGHAKGGTAFVPYFQQLLPEEKAAFIREKYWIWDRRHSFEWKNRKQIQYMRDLYETLHPEMPKPQQKNS